MDRAEKRGGRWWWKIRLAFRDAEPCIARTVLALTLPPCFETVPDIGPTPWVSEMAERRNIGEILKGFGRITQEDVTRAVRYQQQHGGYFGEALVALGLVSQDELDYGLASQFNLPYVFPDAESVDPNAASLVTPEWALAHLTLPIMATSDALTVLVDSPMRSEAVEELHARTDKEIELALASASKIRELIRRVFARGAAQESEEPPVPARLKEVLALALAAASTRFGISVRGHRAWAWYDEGGRIRRRPLDGLWRSELDSLVSPSPAEEIGSAGGRKQWQARINREGVVHRVAVRYMGDEHGAEYLLRPVREGSRLKERFQSPPRGIVSEVRMLARTGSARFIVVARPESLGHEILPHLPTLLLDPSWRSIHVAEEGRSPAGDAFSVGLPGDDREAWAEEFADLRPFHFDVVTADLPVEGPDWIQPTLDIASVAFLLWRDGLDAEPAREAGVGWELRIEAREDDVLDWTLAPLR